MAYRDEIISLNPDHYWTFDGTHNDIGVGPSAPRNTNQSGGNTAPVTGPAITEDASASLQITGPTSRTECLDTPQINSSIQTERSFGGWFMPTEIARPPAAIYKEGGGTNNFAVLLGFGNTMLAQSVDANDHDVQVYSDRTLTPNRSYHYICIFKASANTAANDGDFALYIDGIRQSIESGNPFDTTQMASHGADIDWGDPDGNINIGGSGVGLAGALGYHAHWATWTNALNAQQARFMFELGALPDITISADTVANMQTALDTLADTSRHDTACAIRIEQATDSSDFTLNADNITFDQRCSIHVQYTGPNALTWVNGGGSDASITSVINSGTVTIQTPRQVTLDGLVAGTRVKVYKVSDNSELTGTDNSGTSFIAYLNEGDTVTFRMASLTRRITEFDLTIPSSDTTIPISQQLDRVYENV